MIVPQLKPAFWYCSMKQPHLKGLGHPLDDEVAVKKTKHPHGDDADRRKPLDDEAEIERLGQLRNKEAYKGELGQPLGNRDLEHILDDDTNMTKDTTGEPDIHFYIKLST